MKEIKENLKKAPIFILGVQRSGTTLLRLLLDAHSQIAIPFESFVLIDFYKRLSEYNNLESLEDRKRLIQDILSSKGIMNWTPRVSLTDLDLNKCTTYANAIDEIYSMYASHCGKTIWGDKSPPYTKDFHILNELFPDAKFINIIRDGRDVAMSMDQNSSVGPVGFVNALRYWKEIVHWSRKMGRMISKDRYFELRYEDLVEDPEKILNQVFNFLDLPFEDSVLVQFNKNLNQKLPQASKELHKNLDQQIKREFSFKWKRILSRADQALAHNIAGDLLGELGYPKGNDKASYIQLNWRRFFHWSKAWLKWHLTYRKSRNNKED